MDNIVRLALDSVKVARYNNRPVYQFLNARDFMHTLPAAGGLHDFVDVPALVVYKGVVYLNDLHLVEPDGDGDVWFTVVKHENEYVNDEPLTPDSFKGLYYYTYFHQQKTDVLSHPQMIGSNVREEVNIVYRRVYKVGATVKRKVTVNPRVGLVWQDSDKSYYSIVNIDGDKHTVLSDSPIYLSGVYTTVEQLPGYPTKTVKEYPWVPV